MPLRRVRPRPHRGLQAHPDVPLEECFTELDPRAAIAVVICHHGNRSAYVTQALRRAGFEKVLNLEGGLEAYATVDESVPRY